MKRSIISARSLTGVSLTITLLLFPLSPVLADVGPTDPVGPTTVVGPSAPVGPTDPVGPTTVVGPAAPAGPSAPAGPTDPVGPQPVSNTPTSSTASDPSVTASNSNTGSNSSNSNSSSAANSSTTNVNNTANLTNGIGLTLSSGGNDINHNTKTGTVSTGSIDGSVNVLNIGNSQFGSGSSIGSQNVSGNGTVTLAPSTSRSTLGNQTTGANSSNQNSADSSNVNLLSIHNDATANNNLSLAANTGSNTLNDNTNVGGLATGDINLGVNVLNLLNIYAPNVDLMLDSWNIQGGLNGDLVMGGNTATGYGSSNSNTADSSAINNVAIDNHSTIGNSMAVASNTGHNDVSDNTTTGQQRTGDTTVNGGILTYANQTKLPSFYLVNVFGSWDGTLQGIDPHRVFVNTLNDHTGANSANSNTASDSQNNTLDLSNQATINNNISVNADTGDNVIDRNTKMGDISTGNVNVIGNIVNLANIISHQTGHFWIGIINIFGNWHGNGLATAAPTANSNAPAVGGAQNGTITPWTSTTVFSMPAAPTVQPQPSTTTTAVTTVKVAYSKPVSTSSTGTSDTGVTVQLVSSAMNPASSTPQNSVHVSPLNVPENIWNNPTTVWTAWLLGMLGISQTIIWLRRRWL